MLSSKIKMHIFRSHGNFGLVLLYFIPTKEKHGGKQKCISQKVSLQMTSRHKRWDDQLSNSQFWNKMTGLVLLITVQCFTQCSFWSSRHCMLIYADRDGYPPPISLQIYLVCSGKIQTLCNLCRRKSKQASTRSLIPPQYLTLRQHRHREDGLANKTWQWQQPSIYRLPPQTF